MSFCGLMRFIPRGLGRRDVITHLDDPVTNIEYGATATTGEDFTNYRLKVERYLRDYGNSLVIQKLHRNLPMTEYEFVELELHFYPGAGYSRRLRTHLWRNAVRFVGPSACEARP